MLAKTHAARNDVVVEHAQHPKVNALRVVPRGKTKRMLGVEPTVVGVAA